jgi:ferrous iron transport protein B
MSERLVALAGAPNVGKSTVFNELTGMHQHTGNWIGKTVDSESSSFYYKYNDYTVVDLPGTYSLNTSSREEEIAKEFLMNNKVDTVVCVVDCSLLERSLPLVFQILQITHNAVVLLNLCDEAKKHGVFVDSQKLSELLGVPVVKATARSGKGINNLLEQIHLITTGAISPCVDIDFSLPYIKAKAIASQVVTQQKVQNESLLDKIMLGKVTSFFAMILIFAIVLWLTISFSNYPSDLLKSAFDNFEIWLANSLLTIGVAEKLVSLIVFGILRVLFWVVAVMLPPMAIFFPLFALLEDFGLLPRIAFNLDYCFEKCGACGKQALTCCMGMGCNAVGVTGARIIDSPRERLIAIITNSLTPCNGRFPPHILW